MNISGVSAATFNYSAYINSLNGVGTTTPLNVNNSDIALENSTASSPIADTVEISQQATQLLNQAQL